MVINSKGMRLVACLLNHGFPIAQLPAGDALPVVKNPSILVAGRFV